MKNFKAITAVLLSLVLFVCMAVPVFAQDETDNFESIDENNSFETIEIQEQVIYDEDGRKVTVTGYSEDWMGPEISVMIENGTDSAFTVQIRNSSVNDIMIDIDASIRVEPGETVEDHLTIMSYYLESNGIEQVADLEMQLLFLDSDSYDTLVVTDPIHIQSSLSGIYSQAVNDSGIELYNANGIRIVYQGLFDDVLFGSEPLLYIENDSERAIDVQLRSTSVNGFMIDPVFAAAVMPGKAKREGIIITSSDIAEPGISGIAEIETRFEILDPDTFELIAESDIISIQVGDNVDTEASMDAAGDVLYDSNGIKIVSHGLKEETTWGAEPVFYIENNTEREICVQMRDTSINGIEERPVFSVEIMPGKASVDSAVLFDSVIEETGALESMTTSFHIFDNNTGETLADTVPVIIIF